MGSEANKDDAFKALAIAKRHLSTGNLDRARYFGEKAKSLYPCAEVDGFLRSLQAANGASTSGTRAPEPERTPPADSEPSVRQRNGIGTTPAQKEMVARIRAAKGDYYKVLGVERSAEDDEIKKAYRKLALKLHPDKCQAPGAEEAFKEVSKAFTCLADPHKRAFYDRTGHEDSQSAAAAARGAGGGMYHRGEELSPEDLFNMMFGGMPGMGGFGMGPMHFGFRAHPGFQQQQRGQRTEEQNGNANRFAGLLNLAGPILLLLLALFSNSSQPPASLHYSRAYNSELRTAYHDVPFYVRDADQFRHDYPFDTVRRRKFEHMIENEYLAELTPECKYEKMKEREIHKRARARGRPTPNVQTPACDKLDYFHRAPAARSARASVSQGGGKDSSSGTRKGKPSESRATYLEDDEF